MKILNVMFGKGRGGLEQAALDYHEALLLAGHDVQTVLHPRAAIRAAFNAKNLSIATCAPLGEWDIFAALKLRALAKKHAACAIIGHGNRAIGISLSACSGRIPVIGVAHNYNIKKRMPRCDAVFCITRDLIEECVHLDIARDALFHIPNLIRVQPIAARTALHSPVVIGSLGRFVSKKGFDVLLQAMQALRQQQVDVKLKLGGDGPLKLLLQKQAEDMNIAAHVEFCGWVEDTQHFLDDIDLFVLPSHHEPFGIVLIEAMAAGLPCVTTDTEGPCEIIRQDQDAVMVEKDRPYQMAQAIKELIEHPQRALEMGRRAHQTARNRYDINVISAQLSHAVSQVVEKDNPGTT